MTSFTSPVFSNKKLLIHVVGVSGVEGAAVVSFLRARGFEHIIGHALCEESLFEQELLASHDLADPKKKNALLSRARGWQVPIRFGAKYLSDIEEAELVFVPQSWRLHPERNAKLFSLSVPVRNVMHLYLDFAPCRVVGVTGSDGKTTTTHLIYHLLRAAGRQAWISGNYRQGDQVLEDIEALHPKGTLVLEISNRHLGFGFDRYPDISVITNITENHLSEYATFSEYAYAKRSIIGPASMAVLNADNEGTRLINGVSKERYFFSRLSEGNGAHLVGDEIRMGSELLCRREDILLPGDHNVENVLAALTVAVLCGARVEALAEGVRTFVPVKDRLQKVAEIGGRTIVSDLSGTSMESTRRGILAFRATPLSVVLGGSTKGVDYAPLAKTVKETGANIFGVRSEVTEVLRALSVSVHESETAGEAIETAYKNTPSGGVVLISPAGAFFESRYLSKRGDPNNRSLTEIISTLPPSEL